MRVAVVEALDLLDFGPNPYPLGEFVALAEDGSWVQAASSRVRAVRESSVPPRTPTRRRGGPSGLPPARTSLKWRREGDNLWRAEGAEAATEAASAAFSALESDPSDAFDVVGDADAAAFLDQQRARVASTRAEIEEMKRSATCVAR